MAKRKKIVISNKELEPTVLATLNNKKTNILGIIVLFAIFLGIVYFLPDLTDFYDKYITKTNTTNVAPKPTVVDNDEDEAKDTSKEDKYILSDSLIITNGEIKLNNFKYENALLTFDVTNLADTESNIQLKKYYLTAYSENNSIIQRIKIAEDVFKAKEVKNYSYSINVIPFYFEFAEIDTAQYPEINLLNQSLTCNKGNESLIYTFNEVGLSTIRNTITISNLDTSYEEFLNTYQGIIDTYTIIDGFRAQLSFGESNTTFIALIDTNVLDTSMLNNMFYYPKNTIAKVVSYEMESRGFDCN